MELWDYPDKILPFLPFDFVVIPVVFMLIYQKFRPWKDFVIASTILAAFYAFIAEPVTVWLNLSVFLRWKYSYSFPIYVLIAVIMRWLTERIKARQI